MTTVPWADLQKAAGEAGFDPVPASMYDVIVDKAAHKTAGSGKNMIVTTFKIESGPYAGKPVFNQFVLSPENANALAFFFRHMAALGLNEAYFAANPQLERVAADLIGRRCRIQVSIRQWQGTDRKQVDNVLPAVSAAPAPAGATPQVATPSPSAAANGAAAAPQVTATSTVAAPPQPTAAPPVPTVAPSAPTAQPAQPAATPPPPASDLPF